MYDDGWSLFLSRLVYASKGDLPISVFYTIVLFVLPAATLVAGYLVAPVSIAITESGIVYTDWIRSEQFPWTSIRPFKGVPSGAWAPFHFSMPGGAKPRIRWIDRARVREMLANPKLPRQNIPVAYWSWAGLPTPTLAASSAHPY